MPATTSTLPHAPTLAERKLAWIREQLDAGRTVYVCTYTRATKITPRAWSRWEAAGRPLVKVGRDGSLWMGRGRSYDCIDLCALRAVDA